MTSCEGAPKCNAKSMAVLVQVAAFFASFGRVLKVETPRVDRGSYGALSRAWTIIDYERPKAAALACSVFNNDLTSAMAHLVSQPEGCYIFTEGRSRPSFPAYVQCIKHCICQTDKMILRSVMPEITPALHSTGTGIGSICLLRMVMSWDEVAL